MLALSLSRKATLNGIHDELYKSGSESTLLFLPMYIIFLCRNLSVFVVLVWDRGIVISKLSPNKETSEQSSLYYIIKGFGVAKVAILISGKD